MCVSEMYRVYIAIDILSRTKVRRFYHQTKIAENFGLTFSTVVRGRCPFPDILQRII